MKTFLYMYCSLVVLLSACNSNRNPEISSPLRFQGRTMGTTYRVTITEGGDQSRFQKGVDSLLQAINAEVNTYDSTSMISRLNAGDTLLLPQLAATNKLLNEKGAHLAANLVLAKAPIENSAGIFDPTVGPLVNYYGFGASFRDTAEVDQQQVDELLKLVGFDKMAQVSSVNELEVYHKISGVELDLSAIAKGYAVDQICYYLQREGVYNILVEIGGETRAVGNSPSAMAWTIGVNRPEENAALSDVQLILGVSGISIATSGNYRNSRDRAGVKYVHTINPKTGEALPSLLLSATVLAEDCATADAYATACMASGENAKQILEKANLSGCLIMLDDLNDFKVEYVGNFSQYVLAD